MPHLKQPPKPARLLTADELICLQEDLAGPEGFNVVSSFNYKEPIDYDQIETRCDHSHQQTTRWLKNHGFDVSLNLDQITQLGGTCDCKVIRNITAQNWANHLPG